MKDKLILIGASTGGPGHLKKILSAVGGDFKVPIVIAQHMNPAFIQSFVKQFDSELPQKVSIIDNTHTIEEKNIYICSKHCQFKEDNYALKLQCVDFIDSYYNPSVDCIFSSAVRVLKRYNVLAILLTGIGQDGANAMSELQNHGATCIAESEKSAIVFGMPKRAAELNDKIKVLDLDEIIAYIKRFGE
jgi:two-component system chemotaxis response regulator CheB